MSETVSLPPIDTPSRRGRARDRVLGAAVSLSLHAAGLAALLWTWPDPPRPPPAAVAVTVLLTEDPTPAAAGGAATAARPAPPAKARKPPRPKPAPTLKPVKPQPDPNDDPPAPRLSDAQIAGAAVAGSGTGMGAGAGGNGQGGACDMAARLQNALRRDPLVQAAAARQRGRPMWVWNGDWVRSEGEDGKGLAAVREAVMWEVAFAPAACRSQSVKGLVLMSMGGPGSARLVLGLANWRWSDLVSTRR